MSLLGGHTAEARANRSIMLDFLVDDVDGTYKSLQDVIDGFVNAPTDLPGVIGHCSTGIRMAI